MNRNGRGTGTRARLVKIPGHIYFRAVEKQAECLRTTKQRRPLWEFLVKSEDDAFEAFRRYGLR